MKIILDVKNYVDLFGDDIPDVLVTELSENDINRIKKYQRYIVRNGLYAIELFDYAPNWYNADCTAEELESTEALTPCRVDCPILHITSDSIYWTTYPKHCGPTEILETDEYRLPDANENSLPNRSD